MTNQNNSLSHIFRVNKDIPAMPFIACGAALLLVGLIGVIRVLVYGQEAVYGVTRQVPWGLLIATYAYFVITSTGLAFIGGLGHAFNVQPFARIGKRIVLLAFIILLAGFTQIGMEIGHPFRLMYLFILSPNFSAPIVWMGIFYGIELFLLSIELYLIFVKSPKNHALSAATAFLTLMVGVAATSNLGFVFGSLTARPFYHGIYFPTFLVVSGIAGGCAILLLIHNIIYRFNIPDELSRTMSGLSKLMGLCIGAMLFLSAWKIISSLYTAPAEAYEAATALLSGPLAINFWCGEIIFALLLPLAMLLMSRGKNFMIMGAAGLFFMIGMFFTRYDFIVAGQLHPMRAGNAGSHVDVLNGLVHYAPSSGEWMIFALGLGLFFFFYFLAERFIALEPE
ncbi:MAG: polysulfide reductase NrfD [Deltaproteobacteria bacterium]|nr:polysulfide reductase NrfD [Deltaproteobacteria bacterium]